MERTDLCSLFDELNNGDGREGESTTNVEGDEQLRQSKVYSMS